MSERVKRFFEQRRLAAEGTWAPPERSSAHEREQAVTKTFFFADSIGLPPLSEVRSTSKPPQRIERFFQRRRDAEEGTWSPPPEMMLSANAIVPRTLAPVPRHGAPLLAQEEPQIAWNRPKSGRQVISFRLDDSLPDDTWEARMLLRVGSVGAACIGLALALQGSEYAFPLVTGSILIFLSSFLREEVRTPEPSQEAELPKKPPQAVPFQLAWATTRNFEEPSFEEERVSEEETGSGIELLSEEGMIADEDRGLFEFVSSHHESI